MAWGERSTILDRSRRAYFTHVSIEPRARGTGAIERERKQDQGAGVLLDGVGAEDRCARPAGGKVGGGATLEHRKGGRLCACLAGCLSGTVLERARWACEARALARRGLVCARRARVAHIRLELRAGTGPGRTRRAIKIQVCGRDINPKPWRTHGARRWVDGNRARLCRRHVRENPIIHRRLLQAFSGFVCPRRCIPALAVGNPHKGRRRGESLCRCAVLQHGAVRPRVALCVC